MKNQSLTISGLAITLLAFISQQFDLGFSQSEVSEIVMGVVQVTGIFLAWHGRTRKKDINLFGRRITKK